MAIIFRIDGLAETKRFVTGAALRARDTRPARKDIGEEMLVRTENRMNAGIDVHGKPFKKAGRGGTTLMDTGRLAASVSYNRPGPDLDLFSSDKRARVHFLGLPIVPKKKFLTIPLSGGAADRTGVNVNRLGSRASNYKNTFFLRKNGKLFLMQNMGKGKDPRALFILLKKVQMVRREWLGFSADDMEMVERTFAKHITGDSK